MSNWLDKAKEAALSAAESAKKAAQNANLGEMLDKTKNIAMEAAENAKNVANSVMAARKDEDSATTTAPGIDAGNLNKAVLAECSAKIQLIEKLLQEIKNLLSKQT